MNDETTNPATTAAPATSAPREIAVKGLITKIEVLCVGEGESALDKITDSAQKIDDAMNALKAIPGVHVTGRNEEKHVTRKIPAPAE